MLAWTNSGYNKMYSGTQGPVLTFGEPLRNFTRMTFYAY